MLRFFSTSIVTTRHAPVPPTSLLELTTLVTDAHHAIARDWVDRFTLSDIPRDSCHVSYARSSGPGGQHVNKTNSKAIVKCDIDKASGVWLPPFLLSELRKSAHYHAPALQLASQETRSAPQNLAVAMDNLHASIVSAARACIRGETSEAQKERVKGLVKAEEKRKRAAKEAGKRKKESRRKDW